MLAVDAFGHAERKPVDADHHHVVFDAQFSRDNIHDTDLAAVAVKQHHLAHAACGYTVANLAPHADNRFSRESQRAGIKAMLIALANGLSWEKQRVAFVR